LDFWFENKPSGNPATLGRHVGFSDLARNLESTNMVLIVLETGLQ
jgi:hypothetical protein